MKILQDLKRKQKNPVKKKRGTSINIEHAASGTKSIGLNN